MNRSDDIFTSMQFDNDRIELNIAKNTATSYGLTLVAAFPPPPAICDSIQRLQGQLEQSLPGRFTWYERDWLHVTLLALLRGRYREQPPLQAAELPADMTGFARTLDDVAARIEPFFLNLSGLHVSRGGLVLVNTTAALPIQDYLADALRLYPEIDHPRHPERLHVTIGYLNSPYPFQDEAEQARFSGHFTELAGVDVGAMVVDRIWLVHYANRRLSQVVGKLALHLGRSIPVSGEDLLRDLDIGIT
jgi:2'-5' RNA ligase